MDVLRNLYKNGFISEGQLLDREAAKVLEERVIHQTETAAEGGANAGTRYCCRFCTCFLIQMSVTVFLFFVCIWCATLLLEPFRVIGITTTPPGLVFENARA